MKNKLKKLGEIIYLILTLLISIPLGLAGILLMVFLVALLTIAMCSPILILGWMVLNFLG